MTDDKLSLVYKGNTRNKICVQSPAGSTETADVGECVTQGSGLGPILCAVAVDIGKDNRARREMIKMEASEHTYIYKKSVEIESLLCR